MKALRSISQATNDSTTIIYAPPRPELLARRIKHGIYVIESDGMYKRCSRCKDYWPADSEFFFTCKSQPDGLAAWCKACYTDWRYPNGRGAKKQVTHVGVSQCA